MHEQIKKVLEEEIESMKGLEPKHLGYPINERWTSCQVRP